MSVENISDSRGRALEQIRAEVVNLKGSPLFAYRQQNKYLPVIGSGDTRAKIMFVGEAPGRNEAKTGLPFCGAAGKILDKMLAGAGIKREEVYITNIVKDRPQENRDPGPEEIKIYGPFLDRQIEIIQPKIIATLGRYSMRYILDKLGAGVPGNIGDLHGKRFKVQASYGPIEIAVLYHPAVAVYNPSMLAALQKDFRILHPI